FLGNSRTTAEAPTASSESFMAGPSAARQLLDENSHRGAVTERHACAVDLAKKRAGAADFRDEGRLAEAHLADALAEIGVAGQLAHAPRRASGKLAERDQWIEGRATHVGERRQVLRLGFSGGARAVCGHGSGMTQPYPTAGICSPRR